MEVARFGKGHAISFAHEYLRTGTSTHARAYLHTQVTAVERDGVSTPAARDRPVQGKPSRDYIVQIQNQTEAPEGGLLLLLSFFLFLRSRYTGGSTHSPQAEPTTGPFYCFIFLRQSFAESLSFLGWARTYAPVSAFPSAGVTGV